jgi:Glycosyltransferase Family 4
MAYNIMQWRVRAERHVLMLSQHCCIRVQKQAHALRAKGWRVDSLSYRRPSDITAFDYSFVSSDPKKMLAHLGECGAGIIHVHNEPDSLMQLADVSANGRPIIYDCHDLEQNRFGYVTADERFAFQRADGIINVSDAHRDFAYSLHPWDVPGAVVYSLPMRRWRPGGVRPRHGVVYEGGLQPPGKCSWRDLSVPCAAFAEAGITFEIYTTPSMAEHYPGVIGFLEYHELTAALTGYRFGFVGHDPAHPVYAQAMPNKVWEYAMCGAIPLFVNASHAAEMFGSGIVAVSTRDAIEKMRTCDEDVLRADVLAHARFMDDEIDKTIALYEQLLGKRAAA